MSNRNGCDDYYSTKRRKPRIWVQIPVRPFYSTSSSREGFNLQDSFDNYDRKLCFSLQEEFFDWITYQNYSTNHIVHLRSYFTRTLFGKSFGHVTELQKFISRLNKGANHTIKTARVYIHFLEKTERIDKSISVKYLDVLKLRRQRVDVYIPQFEDVEKNYSLVKDNVSVNLVYLVLRYSGIRLVECLDFFANFNSLHVEKHSTFTCVKFRKVRGSKAMNNVYLPNWVFDQLCEMDLDYDTLRKRYLDCKPLFSLKYLRKVHYNDMLRAGIPESVADFIQGRAGASVSANHYLAKSQQAEFWYEKFVEP